VEPRAVRAAFAELMDRCVPIVQARRLDIDDVVLERFAIMRDESDPDGRNWRVRLPFLASADDWLHAFDEIRRAAQAGPCSPRGPAFVELGVLVQRVQDPYAREGPSAAGP
jgi:hypothetical protein